MPPRKIKHHHNVQDQTPDTGENRPLLFIPYASETSASSGSASASLRPGDGPVRQHLMIDFHRRRHLNQLNRSAAESEDTGSSSGSSKPPPTRLGRFRVEKKEDTSSSKRNRELRMIAPRSIQDPVSTYQRDPFIHFPVPANDDVHRLFGHYMTELNTQGAINKYEREFLNIALGNSACFLMLMTTLVQFQQSQGVSCDRQFWAYRGAAMAALNTQLSDASSSMDQLICTISMLAYIDLRCPALENETAKIHLAAIVNGLNRRGRDTRRPELFCMLLRLSNWCLVPPIRPRPPRPPRYQPLPPWLNNSEDFDFARSFPSQPHGYIDIPSSEFDDIRFLLRSKVEDPSRQPGDDDIMRCASDEGFQDFLSSRLTYAASTLGTRPASQDSIASNMMQSVYLSKIMFLYIVSPAITLSGVSPSMIAMSLRASLEDGLASSGAQVAIWNPELLCWVLVTGAVTTQDEQHRAWFVKRVSEFCTVHGIYSFESLAQLLQRVAWAEGKFASSCQRVWNEINPSNNQ